MDGRSLKCPNCNGEVVFDPASQQYHCPYCGSYFQEIREPEPEAFPQNAEETGKREEAVIYHCPSCGAEIITEETTAATFCYFCHNPVILEGRVSGDYLPGWVIPFSVTREQAVQIFLDAMKKKIFVKRGFFRKQQVEKLTGVYLPFWNVNWKGTGRLEADATKVRVWRTGDMEHTETRFYRVTREGELEFPEIMEQALKKNNRMLVQGVLPYRQEGKKKFSLGYLSGFQAEKRDISQEETEPSIQSQVETYAENLLRDTIQGYASVNRREKRIHTRTMDWEYVLVPVWTLTYKGSNGKMYYYAINGQTGKVSGMLPVDYLKLSFCSVFLGLAAAALVLLGGLLI